MLQTVTIQNFKSLRDVTVNLQKVNLLIGPNNSGKSNFLKALAFIKEHLNNRLQRPITDLNRIFFNPPVAKTPSVSNALAFEFKWDGVNSDNNDKVIYRLEILGDNYHTRPLKYGELLGVFEDKISNNWRLNQLEPWMNHLLLFYANFENTQYFVQGPKNAELRGIVEQARGHNISFSYVKGKLAPIESSYQPGSTILRFTIPVKAIATLRLPVFFDSLKIYKPDPATISKGNMLLFDSKQVNEDCSNLVAFLDTIRDQYDDIWQAIRRDLNKCIPEFIRINLDKIQLTVNATVAGKQDTIGKRFGLEDKFGKTYWAEELSEGTIYFLALLAIIHQPDPPKLLLLEEPEKGIHPRRISEVMNLIFRLAEEKDIQIILTTHSTQVVDEFQDIPESVFVFELQDGETKIKNLLTDIIEPDTKKAKAKNYPKLDFSKHSLGEHWAIGFLGGVPAK